MAAGLRWHYGPVSVPAAGQVLAYYWRGPKERPVRVSMINAEIYSGTQTGLVTFYLIGEGDRHIQQSTHELTADDHAVTIYPDTILQPGEGIKVFFTGVAAADVVVASAWGD